MAVSIPQLMQILHAGHGDFETPALVEDIEVAGIEADDLHRRTFGQAVGELLVFKGAAHLGGLAHVVDFSLGIIHGRKGIAPGRTSAV